MTSLIKLSYLSLLPAFLCGFFPTFLQADKTPVVRTGIKGGHYTLQDYKTVKKFDVHIHVNTAETHFMELAKKDNFQFLVIVDDRPFGLPMDGQQATRSPAPEKLPRTNGLCDYIFRERLGSGRLVSNNDFQFEAFFCSGCQGGENLEKYRNGLEG